MASGHRNSPENPSRTALLFELLAGYILIFTIIGIMFGFAAGIGVEMPWAVLGAMVLLWALLATLIVLTGASRD